MKIEVNLKKKYFFAIMGVLLIIAAGVVVYAYNANFDKTASAGATFGHSADELVVRMDSGGYKTVQELLRGGVGGGGSGGPVFITPQTILFDTAHTSATSTNGQWITYDASSFVPASASAAILEATGATGGPDVDILLNNPSPLKDSAAVSRVLVRKSASDPAYVLLAMAAAGGGDAIAWGQQGIVPLSSATFQYNVTTWGTIELRIRLIGYYN